ncbi:sugar kinase [Exilibacterium tricleocarpae]|uniref:Sugar kinase n=1 Tax=Exilibacterium tricleocarpae TaxID=2591008 RepID=A0A545SRY8_9GAMM|nr:PfkB family carbohydrate kinase [Exilibacterium tricleocarpae]TQV67733.1 sugar kinase [Exilibacterium tricleocarpae]
MGGVFCVGHAVQDFVFAMPSIPTRAQKHRASDFSSVGGGPAATAAVVVAKLGGHAQLAARLGDDSVADLIVAELQGYGVDCEQVRRFPGRRSSVSSVVVDARGERLIVNYLDPQLPASADWLPALPADAAAVLADTRWPEGAAAMLARAKAAGIPGVLDADLPVPRDTAALAAASHIAFSAPGLADYAGRGDYKSALQEVAAATGAWCCVTLGAGGVFYVAGAHSDHLPAFAVQPVDTLGAGDTWHGAFALALAEGRGEVEAVTFASAAAALKVQRFGGRDGVPSRVEVERLIRSR